MLFEDLCLLLINSLIFGLKSEYLFGM